MSTKTTPEQNARICAELRALAKSSGVGLTGARMDYAAARIEELENEIARLRDANMAISETHHKLSLAAREAEAQRDEARAELGMFKMGFQP